MPSTKSLPDAENAFLRSLVQKVLDSASTQTEAAQRLGVSQSYLNEFIGGTRGAGPKLLKGLAKLNPRKSARLLGLADSDDAAPGTSADPRTDAERAVDDEFGHEFDLAVRGTLVEAVQYAAQRGPRFFRRTWWRILLDDRAAGVTGCSDPIALGERLVARAQVDDDEARRDRFIALHGREGEEGGEDDDKRPTLPVPGKTAPTRRGTRRDTPAAKKSQ